MMDKAELLDPTSTESLSQREKEIVEDAQNAGNNPKNTNDEGDGVLQQNVNADAIQADETSTSDGGSDISGGEANLDKTAGNFTGENEYNR